MSINVSSHHIPARRMKERKPSMRKLVIEPAVTVLSAFVVLCLWHFVATTFFTPQFFPGPLLVWHTAVQLISDGELQRHISISMHSILLGFFIVSLIAIPAVLVLGTSRWMREIGRASGRERVCQYV